MLSRAAGTTAEVNLEYLVALLLAKSGDKQLLELNPFLGQGGVATVQNLTLGVMALFNRYTTRFIHSDLSAFRVT